MGLPTTSHAEHLGGFVKLALPLGSQFVHKLRVREGVVRSQNQNGSGSSDDNPRFHLLTSSMRRLGQRALTPAPLSHCRPCGIDEQEQTSSGSSWSAVYAFQYP